MFSVKFHNHWRLIASILVTVSVSLSGSSQAADDIGSAIMGGKVSLDMRYRYELVDQSGLSTKSHASTVRTRLGYMTDNFRNVSAFLELENTTKVLDDDYTVPAASPYGPKEAGEAVIADPIFSEVNQAWLQYAMPDIASIRYGRERVVLDNARFIGNVGWRQNEQTYDALTIRSSAIPDSMLFYGYFTNANTVAGTNLDMRSNIINASYSGLPIGTLTAYGYLLDFKSGSGTDTATIGARFSGKYAATQGFTVSYSAEYANQSDYQDSNNIDVNYLLLEAGGGMGMITGNLGFERLEGDGTVAFQTPLATLHGFNGWADKFLTTPPDGLEDLYFSLGATVVGIKLVGVYHDFSADEGGSDYGTEIDLLAAHKYNKNFSSGVKYANYNAKDFSVDTKKFWIWGQMAF